MWKGYVYTETKKNKLHEAMLPGVFLTKKPNRIKIFIFKPKPSIRTILQETVSVLIVNEQSKWSFDNNKDLNQDNLHVYMGLEYHIYKLGNIIHTC